MSKFKDLLKKKIQAESADRATNFIQSRNDSIHEVGINRGYLTALGDVMEWSQEIERQINDA